jgi:TolB-like protein/Tfp pilus assembly protein PilF
MKNFLQELKRRNVIKAALSYLVVGWLILQVASIVFPMFNINDTYLKWVFIFLAIAFPAWVIFAYIYELTPSGFKKTNDVEPEQSLRKSTSKKLNAYIIAGLSMAVILLLFDRFFQVDVSLEDNTTDISIAILPFKNVSASEDAYFAAGITEDILTQVSKIGDIRVLSSLSLIDYDMTGKTPDEMGKELGVSHILTLNVRRSEGNLRIGCQLVGTNKEGAIWAQTYDKKMSNVFAMQSEIAFEIAASLDATISEREEEIIEKKPTDNMVALDLVYRGRELRSKGERQYYEQAVTLFKEAIALDPFYSTAYSNLSITYSSGIETFGIYSRDYLDTALLLAQKAIDLGPDFSYNWYSLGRAYSVKGKNEQAIAMYQKVLELNPNSSLAYHRLGDHYRQDGNNWVKAIQMIKKAISLQPAEYIGSSWYYGNLSRCYQQLGLNERAVAAATKSIEIQDNLLGRTFLGVSLAMLGDTVGAIDNLDAMLKLAPESTVNLSLMTLLHFEYVDLEKGKAYLKELKAADNFDVRTFPNTVNYDAYIALQEGRVDNATALLSENLNFYLGEIQKGVQFQDYLYQIATIYAIQNDQDKAIEWLNRLVDDGWIGVNAINNSRLFENLQENEDYIQLIDRLEVELDSLRDEVIRDEMNTTIRSY